MHQAASRLGGRRVEQVSANGSGWMNAKQHDCLGL